MLMFSWCRCGERKVFSLFSSGGIWVCSSGIWCSIKGIMISISVRLVRINSSIMMVMLMKCGMCSGLMWWLVI